MKVAFNVPAVTGRESFYLSQAINNSALSGDGNFSQKCHQWLVHKFQCRKALLTPSCTHALEMSAILADIKNGDEVIMPSYTFVSTANAFILRGARIKFIDIRPDTMNMDEMLIKGAVTARTRAIVPVHYAGVACAMDTIMELAAKYNLMVIEDAAQGMMARYRGQALGTIGHLGCYSFHDTKNYTCGEGGAFIINDERFACRAEYVREKGTDRSRFLRGEADKYTWVDVGSSYLLGELNAAYLFAQLEAAEEITADRLNSWYAYHRGLKPLAEKGLMELPQIPAGCEHNASIFYIKVKDLNERTRLTGYLKERGIAAVFHYIPLHSSQAGKIYGEFCGQDRYTTRESERLLRLPLYYRLGIEKINYIIEAVRSFYEG